MKIRSFNSVANILAAIFAVCVVVLSPWAMATTDNKPVTIDNFVRAESDTAIQKVHHVAGLGKFFHLRTPAPLDKQDVIRMNRDTLYSSAVLDLSKPATVTLPDTGGRYMSLHVISQDHYMFATSKPGKHTLTQKQVGSRYAYLIVRTFVDANDAKDIAAANAMQDKLSVKGGTGTLDIPKWDQEQLKTAREALNTLAKMGMDASRGLGTKEHVDPLQHLVAAAAGWGGLPEKNAFYEIEVTEKNDGTPHTLTVKDVPVDAFWSITVYNSKGYIEENDRGAYSYNNVTSAANKDGSITINFAGCDDGRINCLPVTKGWNYAVRMYEPRQQILGRSWKFPAAQPSK